jgi:hypothetical protein
LLGKPPLVELLVDDLPVAAETAFLAADVTELMPPAIAVVAFLTAPFTDEATSFAPGREDDPLTIGPRMIGSFGLVASGTSGCGGVVSWLLTSDGSVEGGVEPFGVVSVGFGIAKAC